MIKLNKLEEPEVLKINKEEWTSRYLSLYNAGSKIPDSLKYKYREPEIKDTLIRETHDKCAYCESKISQVCYGDVEHIIPKSKKPELIFEWKNLTLSCEQCNRNRKGDYYDEDEPLIDPYKDNPNEYLFACGAYIFHKPGSRRGELTETILELNRVELIERRMDRIKSLKSLADKCANEKNSVLKNIFINQLLEEANTDKEYSFVVRKYLKDSGII